VKILSGANGLGTRSCAALPNETGSAALMHIRGSDRVDTNELYLAAAPVRPGTGISSTDPTRYRPPSAMAIVASAAAWPASLKQLPWGAC
jgi:hypothetical protein